jgi:hypothetical protein
MAWPPVAALILALLAGGCGVIKGLSGHVTVGPKQPPVVYATGGGSAMLTVIACPRTVEAAAMVHQLLELLINSAASIVTADSESTARFVLNGCPFAEAFTAPSARRTR